MKDWFRNRLNEVEGRERDILSDAYLYIDTVYEKLRYLKYDVTFHIQENSNTETLPYIEGIRLLIIKYLLDNKESCISTSDIAKIKCADPSIDDIANEGRIVNQLETKGLIDRKREENRRLVDCELSLTNDGKCTVDMIESNNNYLKSCYNRSRNTKIKKFILNYLI